MMFELHDIQSRVPPDFWRKCSKIDQKIARSPGIIFLGEFSTFGGLKIVIHECYSQCRPERLSLIRP